MPITCRRRVQPRGAGWTDEVLMTVPGFSIARLSHPRAGRDRQASWARSPPRHVQRAVRGTRPRGARAARWQSGG
jgi:hypothetical protein